MRIAWTSRKLYKPGKIFDPQKNEEDHQKEIFICTLLSTLEQINTESVKELSEGIPVLLVMGVSVGVVVILIIFCLIARWWFVRWVTSRCPTQVRKFAHQF